MTKLDLGTTFQNTILKYMIENEGFALKCSTYLSANYFENKYLSWIFTKLQSYTMTYGSKPTWTYLMEQLKTLNPSEIDAYKSAIKNTGKVPLQDILYIKDELTKFIKTSEFKKMHNTEADLFNNNKYDEAYAYVNETIQKIRSMSFTDDDYIKSYDIDNCLAIAQHSSTNRVPTGIDLIDKELMGGLPKKSVTTVLGAWNSGKSIFSINLAYYAMLNGKKVLYIFHEGRREQIVIRFLSRITGIPYYELCAGDYKDDAQKVKKVEEAKKFIELNIRIKEMRKIGTSVEDVVQYCKSTYNEWPFDEFIDDYGQKLISSKNQYREIRHVLAHIWNCFDMLSAELDIAVITLAQLNREYAVRNRKGLGIIRSEGISEAAAIAHVSETILTINRSPNDDEENKLIVCLDKARDARAGMLIECNTRFRTMQAFDKDLGFSHKGYDLQLDKND